MSDEDSNDINDFVFGHFNDKNNVAKDLDNIDNNEWSSRLRSRDYERGGKRQEKPIRRRKGRDYYNDNDETQRTKRNETMSYRSPRTGNYNINDSNNDFGGIKNQNARNRDDANENKFDLKIRKLKQNIGQLLQMNSNGVAEREFYHLFEKKYGYSINLEEFFFANLRYLYIIYLCL